MADSFDLLVAAVRRAFPHINRHKAIYAANRVSSALRRLPCAAYRVEVSATPFTPEQGRHTHLNVQCDGLLVRVRVTVE